MYPQGIGQLSAPQQMPQQAPQMMPQPGQMPGAPQAPQMMPQPGQMPGAAPMSQPQMPQQLEGLGVNIAQAQERLKDLADGQLMQYLQTGGGAPPVLVLGELNRRKRMRDGAAEMPQQTVADELFAEALQGGIGAIPRQGMQAGGAPSSSFQAYRAPRDFPPTNLSGPMSPARIDELRRTPEALAALYAEDEDASSLLDRLPPGVRDFLRRLRRPFDEQSDLAAAGAFIGSPDYGFSDLDRGYDDITAFGEPGGVADRISALAADSSLPLDAASDADRSSALAAGSYLPLDAASDPMASGRAVGPFAGGLSALRERALLNTPIDEQSDFAAARDLSVGSYLPLDAASGPMAPGRAVGPFAGGLASMQQGAAEARAANAQERQDIEVQPEDTTTPPATPPATRGIPTLLETPPATEDTGTAGVAAEPLPDEVDAVPDEENPLNTRTPFGRELLRAERSNINVPLMMAGLSMLASSRPDFFGALGEGGVAGLKTMVELRQQEDALMDREADRLARAADREADRIQRAADREADRIQRADAAQEARHSREDIERQNREARLLIAAMRTTGGTVTASTYGAASKAFDEIAENLRVAPANLRLYLQNPEAYAAAVSQNAGRGFNIDAHIAAIQEQEALLRQLQDIRERFLSLDNIGAGGLDDADDDHGFSATR